MQSERTLLEREVLKQFRVIVSVMKEHFQAVEKSTGLSGSQLWALSLIQRSPGIRVNELAHSMSILKSSASNLLDKLEEKHLIRRERNDPDQRVVRLYPTEAGLQQAARMPACPEGIIPNALGRIPVAQLELLQQSLGSLIAFIDVADEQVAMTPLAELSAAL